MDCGAAFWGTRSAPPVGRVIYMRSYVRDPASRGLGFGVQALATVLLLIGGLVAIVWGLVKTGL